MYAGSSSSTSAGSARGAVSIASATSTVTSTSLKDGGDELARGSSTALGSSRSTNGSRIAARASETSTSMPASRSTETARSTGANGSTGTTTAPARNTAWTERECVHRLGHVDADRVAPSHPGDAERSGDVSNAVGVLGPRPRRRPIGHGGRVERHADRDEARSINEVGKGPGRTHELTFVAEVATV